MGEAEFRAFLERENVDYRPIVVDLFDDQTHYTTKFKHASERLQAVGTLTTFLLRWCEREDAEFDERLEEYELGMQRLEEEYEQEMYQEGAAPSPTTLLSKPRVQRMLKNIYDAWLEYAILNMETLREVKLLNLDKAVFGTDEQGHERKLRMTMGTNVFYELTRLHALMHRPQVLSELDNLACYPLDQLSVDTYVTRRSLAKNTKHPLWLSIVNTFDYSKDDTPVKEGEKPPEPGDELKLMKQRVESMWNKPIYEYTQTEASVLVSFLTQQINDLPTQDKVVVQEFREVLTALWLRIGTLTNELHPSDVLDDETMRRPNVPGLFSMNREYTAYCSIYVLELLRRFFYHDILSKNDMGNEIGSGLAASLREGARAWIERAVYMLPDEAFEELYYKLNNDGYAFPGDDLWFKYHYPNKIHSRGACITEFRPHLHRRFFSEGQLSKAAVLKATTTSYTARLFVFKAVDEALGMQVTNVTWLNAVVIMNDGIEMAAYKLDPRQAPDTAPTIVQVLSSFWVHYKGRVHVCDDVYEAYGVWCYLLALHCNSRLFEMDLTQVINEVLPEEVMFCIRGAALVRRGGRRHQHQQRGPADFEL